MKAVFQVAVIPDPVKMLCPEIVKIDMFVLQPIEVADSRDYAHDDKCVLAGHKDHGQFLEYLKLESVR